MWWKEASSESRFRFPHTGNDCTIGLFVDPVVDLLVFVVVDLVWLEPMSNLTVSRVDGIRSVADVASGLDAEVSADGSWGGREWVGGSEHDTSLLDDVESLPDHRDNWSRAHVLDERWEEWLVLQVLVVDLKNYFRVWPKIPVFSFGLPRDEPSRRWFAWGQQACIRVSRNG